MTDDLRTLLRDRAESVSFDPVDVGALERDGARAVRRQRRLRVVAGSAGVALAVLVASLVAAGLRGDGTAAPVTGSPDRLAPSWAQGSVIHDGDRRVDVGHPVARYVQTSLGYVFTDDDGVVWSWRDGAATRVGHTAGPLYVAPAALLVGWVDDAVQAQPAHHFAVFDQATGRAEASQARTEPAPWVAPGEYLELRFVGLDPTAAWWLDGDGYYRQDLTWGVDDPTSLETVRPVRPQPLDLPPRQQLLAVGDGVTVAQDVDTGVVTASRDGKDTTLASVAGGTALLSPDAAHVAFGAEARATAQVYDTATGEQTRLEPDAWSALVTQWLDADTVALLVAETEDDPFRLETCSIRTATCAVAVPDLGSSPRSELNAPTFRVPTGDYWFPYPHG